MTARMSSYYGGQAGWVGQAGSLRRVVNPPVLVISDNASAGLQPQPAGCLTEKEHVHTVKGLG
jgi:hypothetical protein